MPSRRVRQVGRVRWVRLSTNERVSQCGRFLLRPPAYTPNPPKRWSLWYRDPLLIATRSHWSWDRHVWSAKLLRHALEAAAVFEAACRGYNRSELAGDVAELNNRQRKLAPKLLDGGATVELPAWAVDELGRKLAAKRWQYALAELAAAEDAGELTATRAA